MVVKVVYVLYQFVAIWTCSPVLAHLIQLRRRAGLRIISLLTPLIILGVFEGSHVLIGHLTLYGVSVYGITILPRLHPLTAKKQQLGKTTARPFASPTA
jgi:hypothetical protein